MHSVCRYSIGKFLSFRSYLLYTVCDVCNKLAICVCVKSLSSLNPLILSAIVIFFTSILFYNNID